MASARVTLVVEVYCSSNWGDTTTAGQIFDQAKTEALGYLDGLFMSERSRRGGCSASIVGKPVVNLVVQDNQNKKE